MPPRPAQPAPQSVQRQPQPHVQHQPAPQPVQRQPVAQPLAGQQPARNAERRWHQEPAVVVVILIAAAVVIGFVILLIIAIANGTDGRT
jgi:hypothetical protein